MDELSRGVAFPPHPADKRQRLALLLVAQQRDALHQVSSQDEILDAEHLVDVELRVDEGHTRQVIVLQDPQEDLKEEITPFVFAQSILQIIT